MSGLWAWVLMTLMLWSSGYALTCCLAILRPDLTWRERWSFVWWLACSISAAYVAVEVGSWGQR